MGRLTIAVDPDTGLVLLADGLLSRASASFALKATRPTLARGKVWLKRLQTPLPHEVLGTVSILQDSRPATSENKENDG
jgi:hypothetical protein